jgi:hypothetical protein
VPEIDPGTQPDGAARPALLAGSLLFVLALLVSVADGFRAGLALMVTVAALAGGVAAVRGRGNRLSGVTSRATLGVAAAGFAAVVLGGAVPPPAQDTAAQATVPPTGATSSPEPALPPAPAMAMTCPAGATGPSPVFGQQITATGPYSVTIDYGDGDVYRNADQHLGAIFSHTYLMPGTFEVTAVLTDAAGQTASAGCTYRWTGRG